MGAIWRQARNFVLTILAMAWAIATFAEERLEIIPPAYRSAEEVIPILEPLLGRDGTVSGLQNRLIVRATPERLAEIRRVLAEIDRAPRRLLVTLRSDRGTRGEARAAQAAGRVGVEGGEVRLGADDRAAPLEAEMQSGGVHAKAKVWATEGAGTDRGEQRLQVLEGRPAFIQAGRLVPHRVRNVWRDASGRWVVQDSTVLGDATSGFAVVVRLVGDTVTLTLRPRLSRVGTLGRLELTQGETVVSGRLGEWLEIGGVSTSESGMASGVGGHRTSQQTTDSRLMVKVELLP